MLTFAAILVALAMVPIAIVFGFGLAIDEHFEKIYGTQRPKEKDRLDRITKRLTVVLAVMVVVMTVLIFFS